MLLGIMGFLSVLVSFFFGGFVILDFVFERGSRILMLGGGLLIMVLLAASLGHQIFSSLSTSDKITAAGVLVALFIGGMQVVLTKQQKDIAGKQKDIAERQASINERSTDIAGEQQKISERQATIAERQASTSSLQGEIQAVSSWLPFLTDQERNSNIRFMSVTALERIGTEAVLAPLAIALSDPEEVVRRRAASALSKLPTRRTIDILVQILGNQDESTRNAAVDTLVRINYRYVLEMQQALEEAPPQIRAIGQEVIGGILLNSQVMEKVGALASHELALGNRDIVVAIIGTGVDKTIPDISNALIEEVDHVGDSGKSGVSTTMIARLIIGGRSSDIVGVAPGVRLISERVIGDDGTGRDSMLISAISHAVSSGADIIYTEVGRPGSSEVYRRVLDATHSQGCLIVAPAGNSNSEEEVVPAADDNVLAVAATDANDRKASYSSYGDWVGISAPGSPMPSSDESGSAEVSTLTGTSYAGAIVAGAAALVWSADPSLSSQRVQEILLNSADDIDDLNPDFEQKLGSGRLNILEAVRSLQGLSP